MLYFWVIIAYLVVLIGVGAYRAKFVRTQDDFMVAGRKLSAKVLVGTLLATWIGSGSIIAGAGLAYDKGFPALWFDAGVWAALIILFLIAPRARRFGQYTVPDILEARYNKYARLLGTIVTIIAYTAIVSYQFRAGGVDDSGHPVEAVVKKENTVTKSEKYKELRKSFITISGYNMGLLLSIIRIAGG
ncbi:MAG: hypothetical protein DRP46_11975 [Candidatus Zixiibacteriota bacterium]|nr:MAG: hypothetical protein DRP46_11975 [candidate division Zixibacteria bacterium]